jgi:hypothetical protein
LREWTGHNISHFAYPNGAYDEISIAEVAETGYESAVTSDAGMNAVGDNLYSLSRLNLNPDGTVSEILARASGLEDAVSGFLRGLRNGRSHA